MNSSTKTNSRWHRFLTPLKELPSAASVGGRNSLPEQALLHFDNLRSEYAILVSTLSPALATSHDVLEIVNEKNKSVIQWHHLYLLDLFLAEHKSLEELRHKLWNIRSRYRSVAGKRNYEEYIATKPPEPFDKVVTEEVLRADYKFLLGELYLRYAITPTLEQVRNQASRRLVIIVAIGILVALIFISILMRNPNASITLFGFPIAIRASTFTIVVFMGGMGGLLSMFQRYQSIPDEGDTLHNVSELRQGCFNFILSPMSGAAFASILYLIIAAGLVSGDIFPQVRSITTSDEVITVSRFLQETGPVAGVDYAKLIVWSFIAGFAERFVPDTLSRFTAKKE